MVDALAENSTARDVPVRKMNFAPDAPSPTVEVTRYCESAKAEYQKFCRVAAHSPSQSPSWIENWAAGVNSDIVFATISCSQMPVFAIAIEIVRRNGINVAQFPGGRHANGNFAPAATGFASQIHQEDLQYLFSMIKRQRPDLDLVRLERQEFNLENTPNPLATLSRNESPNFTLATDLAGGFDAVLQKVNGKRKRKKHRNDTNKFEAHGGMKIVRATSPEEADRLLDFFFEVKARQFRKAGISNVFEDKLVKAFFHSLFRQAASAAVPAFQLAGLEVGGKLLAVTGSSIAGRRVICDFAAIADDSEINASPGEYLHFENIAKACKDGYGVYDFSVGDEPYKRQWCTVESTQFDVVIPLTAKGRIVAAGVTQVSALKRLAKRNDGIWNILKTVRAKLPA